MLDGLKACVSLPTSNPKGQWSVSCPQGQQVRPEAGFLSCQRPVLSKTEWEEPGHPGPGAPSLDQCWARNPGPLTPGQTPLEDVR